MADQLQQLRCHKRTAKAPVLSTNHHAKQSRIQLIIYDVKGDSYIIISAEDGHTIIERTGDGYIIISAEDGDTIIETGDDYIIIISAKDGDIIQD